MDPRDRIRELLLRGDNRLKQGDGPRALDRAREAYVEALRVAEEAGVGAQVRPLVQARLADLDRLGPGQEGQEG